MQTKVFQNLISHKEQGTDWLREKKSTAKQKKSKKKIL